MANYLKYWLLVWFPLTSVFAAEPAEGPAGMPPSASQSRAGVADRDGDHLADGLQAKLEALGRQERIAVVVTFEGPGNAASARKAIGDFELRREFTIIRGFAATMTAEQVRALARVPGVFRVEEDFRVSINLDAAQRDFGTEAARSAYPVDGAGVKICIIDTGVDPGHEQLDNGKVVDWTDYVNGLLAPYDDHGHGTHVASIAAGDGVGGSAAQKYQGVAPKATLAVAKALNSSGYGNDSVIVDAVGWCVGSGARVISMSLGSDTASDGLDALSQAVNAAFQAGVVPLAAAGNAGDFPSTIGSPGAAADAITVAACAEYSAPVGAANHSEGISLAYFSSRGPIVDSLGNFKYLKPDICAPGLTITAANANTGAGYATYSGTSMATPFAAGTVALALQAKPALTPGQAKSLVEETAQDRGAVGKDHDWGAGLLDGKALVAKAVNNTVASSDLTPFPTNARLTGSVAYPNYWSSTFNVTDTAKPIAASVILNGQEQCVFDVGLGCWDWNWNPDIDARILDPNHNVVASSTCRAGSECTYGRQETPHVMPSQTGTYTLQLWVDGASTDKSGSFLADLSYGSTAASPPPPSPPGDTGFVNPASNAVGSGGDGNGFETNPQNAFADGGGVASDVNSGKGTSTSCTNNKKDRHDFYDYAFNVPAGSAIKGIEVQLDARADSASASPKMCVQLSWDGGANWTSPLATTTLAASEATYLLGGANNLWGRAAWSAAEFANFRLRITDVASSTARDFYLDWAAVKVYYQ